MRTFDQNDLLGNVSLGTFAWVISGPFAWKFRLGTFAWELWLQDIMLGEVGSKRFGKQADGYLGAPTPLTASVRYRLSTILAKAR